MRLQEFIAIQALTLELMPEIQHPAQRQVLHQVTISFVTWIVNGDQVRTARKVALSKK